MTLRAGQNGRRHFYCIFLKQKWYWYTLSWWRHQMETFSALLALCAGNSPIPGEFPSQRPVTRSFDVFFDLHLYKRFSKQPWDWWFETASCSLWRHCNVILILPKCGIINKSVLLKVMTWRRIGYKPLPETMMSKFIGALNKYTYM